LFLGKVKDYFGYRIAIYFGFLSFYTRALAIPASAAVIFWLIDVSGISRYLLFSGGFVDCLP
jgi:hypothetical protein